MARALGARRKQTTAAEQLELAERRAKIDKLQEKIFADAHRFLPVTKPELFGDASDDVLTGRGIRPLDSLGSAWDKQPVAVAPDDSESEDDDPAEGPAEMLMDDEHVLPELIALPFPSEFRLDVCKCQGWLAMFLTERHMREAVMREALENGRKGFGGKAHMFVNARRKQKTTKTKTRSANQVRQYTEAIKGAARIYSTSRRAWRFLSPTLAGLAEFRELHASDLHSVRAAIDHSARNTKQTKPSWIWGGRLGSTEYVRACELFGE